MADFTDSIVVPGSKDERVAAREPIVETMELDQFRRNGSGILESYSDERGDRDLGGASDRIGKLEEAHAAARAEAEKAEAEKSGASPAGDPAAALAATPATTIAAPATPPAPAPAPTPVAEPADEHKARADRFEAANQRLVAELDAERAKPKGAAPIPHKLLIEASEGYVDDPIAATMKFLAAALGVEDPKDPKVAAELRDFYFDLTAKELGTTPDPAHEARRESARTRLMLERDKRAQKAEGAVTAERAAAEAEVSKAAAAAEFIGNRLHTKTGDGRSIADDHPLLTKLSETLDGHKPEALLWKVIERESKTGRLVLGPDDDVNIRAAARLIEDHYTNVTKKVTATTDTKPSTAPTPSGTPPPAAPTSASKDTRTSPAARTLTTADASVAPATPPATPAPTDSKKPKFRTNKERQDYALRHLGK